MGTLAEKLEYLKGSKAAIKQAIINKGVSVADTDTFRSYADKIGTIKTGGNLQAKSQTITTNTTTTIKPDSGYDGLSSVAITTNVASTSLAAFTHYHYELPKENWTLTLEANKMGYLYIILACDLHWHLDVKVAGTKILENQGTPDIGGIDTVASGWTSYVQKYRYSYNSSGGQNHIFLIRIPKATSSRSIVINASSAYGGRWVDVFFGKQ